MKIPAVLARQASVAQKNAPSLLFGAGVVSMVGSTVLACRATLKLDEVLAMAEGDTKTAHAMAEDQPEHYSEQDLNKDLMTIRVRAAVKIAKLYAPSVILGVAGIAALTKSHGILNDRVAGLSAAYTALDSAFSNYRERVVEKYGEDVDEQLRFPREKVKETNPDTGREHTIEVVDRLDGSPYARFFDETCEKWQPEPDFNVIFLKNLQNWFNDKLTHRGHVFLNEVYDGLGLPRSPAGAVVGWVTSKDGDNYVDFGLFNSDDSVKRAFINGHNNAIRLDFNVDGPIWDKIDNVPQKVLL